MQLLRLSVTNFRRNLHFYRSFILSLSFCVFMLYDFLNLMDSGVLDIMGKRNQELSDMILYSMVIVLLFFVFCFIWYATNVFLNLRKKEMGTFIFMGLDQKQISGMYIMEMVIAGLGAILLGMGSGMLFFKLFAMLFLRMSGVETAISMQVSLRSVLIAATCFFFLYTLLMARGYVSILRTSIKDMLQATKQSESISIMGRWAFLGSFLAIALMGIGYACAIKVGQIDSFMYMPLAVIFVVIGIYELFHFLLPYLLLKLSQNKAFLYQKERTLWINNLIFRVKKNYRTYAIVTIMMLCSIAALNTGLAFKQCYDAMHQGAEQFSYILMSVEDTTLPVKASEQAIAKVSLIDHKGEIDGIVYAYEDTQRFKMMDMMVSYSAFQTYAKAIGKEVAAQQPARGSGWRYAKKYLISIADEAKDEIPFYNQSITITQNSDDYYFGLMQNNMNFIVLNDADYAMLKQKQPREPITHMQMVKLQKPVPIQTIRKTLNPLIDKEKISTIGMDADNDDFGFVRVMFAACFFMFLVFAITCGGVIFMKTGNDASDDYERCQILKKIGISRSAMKKAIHRELAFTYVLPLVLMMVSSYFITDALESVIRSTNLMPVNLLSIGILIVFYLCLYGISIHMYEKRCGL